MNMDAIIRATFFAEATRRQQLVAENKMRFVHYTSAEVAMSIIQNGAVWMRNATTMNDFSEINHGLACVSQAWKSATGDMLRQALEGVHEGIVQDVATLFDSWQGDMRNNTYLTSLSEHPATEDNLGRLSMWRAYGGRSGVALVLNTTPFEAQTDELAAYSNPVFYGGAEAVEVHLREMAEGLTTHRDALKTLPAEYMGHVIFTVMRFAALCTKHPAFSEEREWRIIYSPNLAKSRVIQPSVQSVRGVPQIVQKIPLLNDPDNGLNGASIPELLHRVIIGPTEDPGAMYDAFAMLLTNAGVPNPLERIWISGIPLRQW